MLRRINYSDQESLSSLLNARQSDTTAEADSVRSIVQDVRTRGDDAVREYTKRFDQHTLTPDYALQPDTIQAIADTTPDAVKAALKLATSRIRAYHETHMPKSLDYTDATGVRLGMRWNAVDACGLYVPGGKASYPSSVLMNAIPAQVAGVARIVMCVPMPNADINPAILYAATLAGVEEIYPIGGAQAIAAMAYGTQTIHAVDIIAGPGNQYVTEAKRQVYGTVGIDMLAGPSEILVVADSTTNPQWTAADLLSQAEHDTQAQSLLITDDAHYAEAVNHAIEQQLATMPRAAIAGEAIRTFGACILTPKTQWAEAINLIAPEHLLLAVDAPDHLLPHIRHAGAIFIGRYTPEAIGDYLAGPSHVLPTTRTARFSSGISVYTFLKKSSLIGCDAESFQALAEATATLADIEGLGAHAHSVRVRL